MACSVHARKRFEAPPRRRQPVGRLSDGTPHYAPLGELQLSPDQRLVCCHLCGDWFRSLAPGHLHLTHGWNHLEYKAAFGLTKGQALQAPDKQARQREVLAGLLRTDPRVSDAYLRAQERMRDPNIAVHIRPHPTGPQPLAQRRRSQESAAHGSRINQQKADEARLELIRSLGFDSVDAYLRQRYVKDKWTQRQLVAELRTRPDAVRRLLQESKIRIRSSVAGNRETRRRQTLTELDGGNAPDGRPWRVYFKSRVAGGASVNAIAMESGRTADWVKRVLRILEIDRTQKQGQR